ncbi:uncharacterized protein LOC108432566 [Pygocentrus nattereri]|uniref:uncharacterized protein LOC108432566 n=1 Tax=Pygocentrus nattereri TaxID=42514 RepID=UPI001890FF42|nr:uncharacterized protein LOC108432566 [Pygocentrus nattereri]
MPRTKTSRRSAAAKKRMADRHGGVADVVVALTDGVMPPHDEKALTDVPESHSPPAWQAVTVAATSETDGVRLQPHNQKALTDIPPSPKKHMSSETDGVRLQPHNQKALTDIPPSPKKHMSSETDGVRLQPHNQKALTDIPPSPKKHMSSETDGVRLQPHNQKALTDIPPSPEKQLTQSLRTLISGNEFGNEFGRAIGKAFGRAIGKAIGRAIGKAIGRAIDNDLGNINENVHNACHLSVEFPQEPTVRGSFHQGHPRFGVNANKQCVANSVTAIMMSRVKNVLSWTTRDLDDVLLNGDRLYSSIRDAGVIHDASGYLLVRDLPTEHSLHGHWFELSYSDDMFVGLFGVSEYGEMQGVYMSHDEAVIRVLSQFDACLFTVNVNTCAIIKQGSWFVLIDSHARNAHGEEEDGDSGTSLVAYHANMESLLNHVTILGLSLSAESAPFEITGVVATVADVGSELESLEGNGVSVTDVPERETHDEHAENEPRQVGDVSQRGVKRSRGQFLYSDAVRGKRRAPDAERVSVVNDESEVSADDRAERYSRSAEPLVSDVVLIGETQSESFRFSPLTAQQQKSLFVRHGIVYVEHGHVDVTAAVSIGEPCETQTIAGDGNCFFRSLAFALRNYTTCPTASTRHELERRKKEYESNEQKKKEKVQRSLKRYYEDDIYRSYVMKRNADEYRTNEQYKQQKKNLSINKYATNLEHREHVKELSVSKYSTNLEHREHVKELSVSKYSTNMEHREHVKELSVSKYSTNLEHRKHVKELSVSKYSTNLEHREHVKELSICKYATNECHREAVKKHSFEAYHRDPEYQAAKKHRIRNVERRNNEVKRRKEIEHVTEQFRQKIRTGPEYVCSVCHRILFKKQVLKCKKEDFLKRPHIMSVAQKCITDTYLHTCNDTCTADCTKKTGPAGSLWICYTCQRKILGGKMPEESVANHLSLEPIPPELHRLNSLEQHLVGMHIPFMRLVCLPKGGQNGVHGPVTCVPSNITDVTQVLPRSENADLMIRVKLKRKLTYKGHYEYEFVQPENIKNALMYLKEHNKFYSDVQFNNDWINPLNKAEEHNDECEEHVYEESTDINFEDENIDETLHDRQQHGMFMDTCLQPVDIAQEVLDQHFDQIMSLAPGETNNPVRLLTDESNEAKCFPVLFPRGTGTFHDNRPEKLTLCRYLNTRILNADGRFAKNLDYLFYSQYLSELQQIVSNVSIAVRKGHDTQRQTHITSEMLTNKESLQRILNYDEGYKFLKPIRGTPVFWQSVQKDLFAMVRQLGIPTWFCSFSSADLRWPELLQTILKQEGKEAAFDELDWSERCALLKTNPVTAARMFDHRFHCFLKDVIMSEAQPIGKIVDYFYRVEFQQRGSPHTHCLFWVENAPQIDKDEDHEVVAFVDHYVTCEMPPEDDKEMHEIVLSVQRHSKRHSKTCKKKGTTCRFNFPRPPSNRTFITRCTTDDAKKDTDGSCDKENNSPNIISPRIEKDLAEAIVKKVKEALMNTEVSFDSVDDLFASLGINQEIFEAAYLRMIRKTSVVLKRAPCDVWVNQYNRDLLRCWNANMDIQFVVDAYSCIVYIISYISKAEREMGLLLSCAQKEASKQGNVDAKQALRKLGSVFLHNREVSAQESVYRLTNMKLKAASRKVQFIPTGHAIRMSLPLNVIQKKAECSDEERQNIWMTSITDRYKRRPKTEEFAKMCLATFASEYRILSKSEGSSTNSIKLDKGLGFVKKRTRTDAAVILYARFSPTKDPEKYYQSILQLFLPHYLESQLKPSYFNTYQEFYETGYVKFCDELCSVKLIVDSNRAMFEKEADIIDQAQEDLEMHGPMEDAWAEICPESEGERLECLASRSDQTTDMDEHSDVIPDLLPKSTCTWQDNPHCMPKQQAMILIRALNEKQSEIFYKIRQWCLQKTRGENPEPFQVFISGPGGVGKSMLIKALHYEAYRILSHLSDNPDEIHVLLTAPTGVSAYNIDAATIHTCLSIGKDIKLPYQPLGDDKINSLRSKLGNLQILIIDEISMVDHKLLAYVHGRLRQIKQAGDYSPFGKVSIIAVGDFYQLGPVKGKPLYIEPPGVNLWQNHFALAELTDIMRQKDAEFAQLLNRLRKRKKGEVLPEQDINMLKQCETGEGADSTDLHIYATNEEVDDHNRRMLHRMCSDTTVIHAQDFERVAKTGRLERKHGHHATVHNTCLTQALHIGVNARVMLLKNIDVSDGLVNGAFGTVNEVCFNNDLDFPSKIYVTFDNEKAGKALRAKHPGLKPGLTKATSIQPEEERVTNNGGIRRQFPLKFYKPPLLDPLQFTYEPCLGIEDTIIYLLTCVYAHLDKPASTVRVMFFDFSSAFNTIRPALLGDKLTMMGDEDEYRATVKDFAAWCELKHLQLNVTKTKELVLDLSRARLPPCPSGGQCGHRSSSSSSCRHCRASHLYGELRLCALPPRRGVSPLSARSPPFCRFSQPSSSGPRITYKNVEKESLDPRGALEYVRKEIIPETEK